MTTTLRAGTKGHAGSLTSGSVTKTYVPLLDKDGTTIALVNTANVNSPPETTFTYDPSGVSTVSGLANSFPFLYQGLEHEVSDPGQLYFEPSGNVYNPQLQRELSLIGPQGIFGPPSGFGNGGFSGSAAKEMEISRANPSSKHSAIWGQSFQRHPSLHRWVVRVWVFVGL